MRINAGLAATLLLVAACVTTGPATANEADPTVRSAPAGAPALENLLKGTRYEALIRESRTPRAAAEDKGFLPNFGNYFDAANPGWGLDIQRLGNFIFAVWFTYLEDGSPYWYIIVGQLDGMSVTGNIESFKWDPGGNPGNQATATVRGTMTITWSNVNDATATWTLDGEAGSAPISFAQFAAGIALANMTGHYFDFVRPGWGYTLLTQGSVTVMTMYWYKDGQPVWAQGVSTDPGFTQLFTLLLFNGPGLCPSCLDRKGADGPTTEELADVRIDWSATTFPGPGGDPVGQPIVQFLPGGGGFRVKGGPLGGNPFSDISVPTSTQAITSAFQDGYDPEYAWFFDLLPAKGGHCLPFQYDPGIIEFPIGATGTLATAYLGTDEVNGAGRLRVYSDVNCTTRFTFPTFTGPGKTSMLMAPTDGGGVVLVWKATVPKTGKFDDVEEHEVRAAIMGGLFSFSQGTASVLAICMYGMAAAQYFALFSGITLLTMFYSVFPPLIAPPLVAAIISDPCTVAVGALIILVLASVG